MPKRSARPRQQRQPLHRRPCADLTGVQRIAAGPSHGLAVPPDGTVLTWGWNNYGSSATPTRSPDGHRAASQACRQHGCQPERIDNTSEILDKPSTPAHRTHATNTAQPSRRRLFGLTPHPLIKEAETILTADA
ncbi:hypothetical protein [Streptomyces sp. SceaMP-e96]|uniref:hypothetical protein n=1 Tax=Streptomyces sp. SceaMP-e96 TaxID=1100824 RepID=UPI000B89BCB2